jgi:hypothetical protein
MDELLKWLPDNFIIFHPEHFNYFQMRIAFILPLLFTSSITFAQKAEKLIQEKNVERVIKALTTDEMMGRSAKEPQQIEKAAIFLENEFKAIGLQPLEGLTGYRQAFQKDYIGERKIDLQLDGETIAEKDIVITSEKTAVNSDKGFGIQSITWSPEQKGLDAFLGKAFGFLRDTTSSIILVDQQYDSCFTILKQMFTKRMISGRKYDDVFVLGKKSASSYFLKLIQKIESLTMNNIVGVIKGSTKPEEIVIFAGHYDHLGILDPLQGDSIANGADDDASGTTAVVELARYFKSLGKNNRTLIFSAFTAEEIGGYGSIYFSKQINPDKVAAMFNIEMIGKLSKWGTNSALITGFEKSDLGTIIQKNLTGSTFQLYPDPYPEQNLFYRSDNKTLAKLGVPAHTISTDQIPIDSLYHTVDDEFESIDIKNMTNIIRMIAIGAQSVVDAKDTPTRINKSSVR